MKSVAETLHSEPSSESAKQSFDREWHAGVLAANLPYDGLCLSSMAACGSNSSESSATLLFIIISKSLVETIFSIKSSHLTNIVILTPLLQVIQSKCLRRTMRTLWYFSNLQIHSDLGVPYLAEHIRSIAQSLYCMFPDVENPLVRQLGGYLAYSRDV